MESTLFSRLMICNVKDSTISLEAKIRWVVNGERVSLASQRTHDIHRVQETCVSDVMLCRNAMYMYILLLSRASRKRYEHKIVRQCSCHCRVNH